MEGLDTNILVYAFDKSSHFHNRAIEFLESKIKNKPLAVSEFGLIEFYAVITDGQKVKMPLSSKEAYHIVQDFYESKSFVVLPCTKTCLKKIFESAYSCSVKENNIFDFLIASTFKEHDVNIIYTLNIEDFKKFDFIKPINPFHSSCFLVPDASLLTMPPDFIPYGRQSISERDIAAVCSVLRSNFLTQGPKVNDFEQRVIDYCGAKQAVAVNSATSALHIACLALGLGPGDILWTTPITFVASANCALYCGANVDFVDIDPRTYNLCPAKLEQKLKSARQSGNLPKVVIPVHLCWQPCNMMAIHDLSREYGFKIIEDASHAIGGRYQDVPIGNCRFSDITIFSFHPVKIITTGEGGMAVTNDAGLAEKMAILRSHGITRNPNLMTHEPDGPWYYQQIDLGFNYRMTDIQAALGLSQMCRLDQFVNRRRFLAERYETLLSNLPVITPWQHTEAASAWHLYVIRLNLNQLNCTHRQVFETLQTQSIGINLHYIPVHTQPWYRRNGFANRTFPEAEAYYQEALTLPLFPAMTTEQQDRVIGVLRGAIGFSSPTEITDC